MTADPAAAPTPDAPVPRLTVLIPVWNAAATIDRAISSVFEDGIDGVECVVVDDGSTDGTAARVADLARRDPRVVPVLLADNAGVSAARNRGLERVRGEWLTFLDADDRLLPGGVAALLRPTRDPDVRAVVGQRLWSDGERTWISRLYDVPDIRQPGRKSVATHPGLVYYASATGKLFHRSLLAGLRFDGRVLGDQPWTIRALLRAGHGIEVIGEDVYEWSRAPAWEAGSITGTTRASAQRSAVAARVARQAFLDVAAEADAQVQDAAGRMLVKRTYAERLFRSDFDRALRTAVERRDPATAEFLLALRELLEVMPQPVLAEPGPLVPVLLRPAWLRWSAMAPDARAAWWRLIEPVRRVDPALDRRLTGSRLLAPLLALARRATEVSPRAGNVIVRALLVVRSLGARVLHRSRS